MGVHSVAHIFLGLRSKAQVKGKEKVGKFWEKREVDEET